MSIDLYLGEQANLLKVFLFFLFSLLNLNAYHKCLFEFNLRFSSKDKNSCIRKFYTKNHYHLYLLVIYTVLVLNLPKRQFY